MRTYFDPFSYLTCYLRYYILKLVATRQYEMFLSRHIEPRHRLSCKAIRSELLHRLVDGVKNCFIVYVVRLTQKFPHLCIYSFALPYEIKCLSYHSFTRFLYCQVKLDVQYARKRLR